MNEDNTNLDLLDLDADSSDSLPEVAFASPRPRKPWLLLGVGLLVIALATYIIVRTVSGNSSSSVEIDLDAAAPEVVVDGGEMPKPMPDVNPQPLPPIPENNMVAQPQPVEVKPQPVEAKPAPVVESEPNVRVVEDRPNVVFNPNKVVNEAPKPVVKKTETKPVKKAETKPAAKTTTKPVSKAATSGAAWYVQFGSYSTRAAADAAGAKMRASHSSLFAGKQFVVLASVLKDGKTTYRLRVAFNNSNDANGFCRNAKSDGLDCYVAK